MGEAAVASATGARRFEHRQLIWFRFAEPSQIVKRLMAKRTPCVSIADPIIDTGLMKKVSAG